MKEKKTGFTLVELLVVIAIIGLLAAIAFIALAQGRAKARDARRVADVRQFLSALELYSNNQVQPTYPAVTQATEISEAILDTQYVASVPQAPSPPDGSCSVDQNRYFYTSYTDQSLATPCTSTTQICGWYTISFCLGSPVGGSVLAGPRIGDPSGLH